MCDLIVQDSAGGDADMAEQQLVLLYGLGLQHLALRRNSAALSCFQGATPVLLHQPLLWLRMAESAIGLHASVAAGNSTTPTVSVASSLAVSASDADAEKLLSDAAQYLRTAQCLLDVDTGGRPGGSERQTISEAVLLKATHVELARSNHMLALRHAQALLAIETASEAGRAAAHVLAAQALSCIDRLDDAVQAAAAAQHGDEAASQTLLCCLLLSGDTIGAAQLVKQQTGCS